MVPEVTVAAAGETVTPVPEGGAGKGVGAGVGVAGGLGGAGDGEDAAADNEVNPPFTGEFA